MTSKKPDIAIIPPSQYNAILHAADIAAEMAEVVLPGSRPTFPRVKVPAGGGQVWDIPGGEPTKELTGILLHRTKARVYWETGFEDKAEVSQPDCRSDDGVTGFGKYGFTEDDVSELNPSCLCKDCPMSKHGSARNNSQACRDTRVLYLLLPEAKLPVVLRVPPSSVREVDNYITGLWAMGPVFYHVVTSIGLAIDHSKTGNIAYAVPTFRKAAVLNPAECVAVDGYREQLLASLARS